LKDFSDYLLLTSGLVVLTQRVFLSLRETLTSPPFEQARYQSAFGNEELNLEKNPRDSYFRSASCLSHQLAAFFLEIVRKTGFERCSQNDAVTQPFCCS
jgi:hypothetical protein